MNNGQDQVLVRVIKKNLLSTGQISNIFPALFRRSDTEDHTF